MSNSVHIPPFAAGGDAAAPADELEVVAGAWAELVEELELDADDECAEV